MLLQLNKIFEKDYFFYFFIFLLAGLRVITSKVRACPSQFDCESYLAMIESIQYDPAIPGHHGMRVLPVLLARGIHVLGVDPTTAFQIVSGSFYILLGLAVYWVLRREKQAPWVAFAFSLLCLAPDQAMRISLQLVYQACDMMTYLFTLGILYSSFKRRVDFIFILSLLGILTRQNLFILGELSLIYCFTQRLSIKPIIYAFLLALGYFSLQVYYHATGIFGALLHPPEGYFTVSHLWHIVIESKVLALFVPLIPFLFFSSRALVQFFIRYWHAALYMMIVIGQPLLAYHLTGNNTQRLALQGVWVLFLACGLTWSKQTTKTTNIGLVLYSLGVYFIWRIPERLLFALGLSALRFVPKRL